ncbi:unnamed protein product [Acanthoscelides obtectus]|uniref:Uncharacterized protein n=1 Tax=Acanthoscelides obtectus TaxID=200917 RepID=A0A9P0KUY8_ACAOB|nr:unnamed protein product [Acanthoscelides obtectus]CAK1643471.1 hypothetical protein AOBTE_LOCUS13540 [Acanthoscelides obtectus]
MYARLKICWISKNRAIRKENPQLVKYTRITTNIFGRSLGAAE